MLTEPKLRAVILLDGPMGTELGRRGVSLDGESWSARAIEEAPDIVRGVHADYARAGAILHRANTFRTQPRLFPNTYQKLVARAVSLAREGAGGAAVLGTLAPVFDCYEPDRSPPANDARAAHRAMATALRDAGVDRILCETFPHAGEALIAVEESQRTGLETWGALTAGPDGSLMTPKAMGAAARDLVRAGASAVLVCCTGARITLPYVVELASSGVPFGAYANAGVGADWTEMSPRAYAAHAAEWLDAGATILGACCGTGPAFLRELAVLAGREAPRLHERDAERDRHE